MEYLLRSTLILFLTLPIYSQEIYTDVFELFDMMNPMKVMDEPEVKKGIKYIIHETVNFYSFNSDPTTSVLIKKYDQSGNYIYENKERNGEPVYTRWIYINSIGKIDSMVEFTFKDTGDHSDNDQHTKSISLFNDSGKIQSKHSNIWSTRTNTPINYIENIIYEYDKRFEHIVSRKKYEKYEDGSGGLDHSDRYIYDDDLLIEKSWISDRQGGRIIDKSIYRYYDNGSIKNVKNYIGTYLSDEYKFEYYPGGDLKKTIYMSGSTTSHEFEFDKKGRIVHFKNISYNYPERDYFENFTYKNDRLSKIVKVKGGTTTTTEVENIIDSDGYLKEVNIGNPTDINEGSRRKGEFTYDNEGRILKKRFSKLKSEKKYDEYYTETYHYIEY